MEKILFAIKLCLYTLLISLLITMINIDIDNLLFSLATMLEVKNESIVNIINLFCIQKNFIIYYLE